MKKEEEKSEEKVSKGKIIRTLYKENPAFKALIKLSLYFILFLVIIVVVGTSDYQRDEKEESQKSVVTEPVKYPKKYQEILQDTIQDEKKFSYEVTHNEEKYLLTYELQEGIISGIYEDFNKVVKKFVIKENIPYEISLKEENENYDLFKSMNINYINIYNLIELLESNKALKMLEDEKILYKYELEGANITVTVAEEKINKIEINASEYLYTINIE